MKITDRISIMSLRRRLSLWRERSNIYREFAKDVRRYLRTAAPSDRNAGSSTDPRHRETQVTKDYHRVEKGLALRAPKRPFGADVRKRLAELTELGGAPHRAPHDVYAADAIEALEEWNATGGISDLVAPIWTGGAQLNSPEWPWPVAERRSVRDFDVTRKIDRSSIETAAAYAGRTPSVCNRQPWRVTVFDKREQVSEVLSFQNGNRGFSDAVPAVALISVDLKLFAGPEERNQAWIEGGLFAMSLVQAFEMLGLSSCMLNMSVSSVTADAVRAFATLEDSEVIVMMIAFGHARSGARVARSPRRSLKDVLRFFDEVEV